MTKYDKNLITELSDLMEKNNLSGLKFSDGKNSYELTKKDNSLSFKPIPSLPKKESLDKNKKIDNDKSLKSPLVGTAYLSPEPGAKKFLKHSQFFLLKARCYLFRDLNRF